MTSPTLTPHFRDFLPGWLARQPWYRGSGLPAMSPAGFFRLGDPAGAVGIETHLVSDGAFVYQIPMTYRGAPAADATGLICTAEHSELGRRWIYDAVHDPVWAAALTRLVAQEGRAEGRGGGSARGVRSASWRAGAAASVELNRVLTGGPAIAGPDVLGVVMGSWQPGGPDTTVVDGCLAVLRGGLDAQAECRGIPRY
jgi:Maltokinase N-terminal cap domain